ncbi:MAG: TRAP transporter small permease [Geminicoccaceae bacterium]
MAASEGELGRRALAAARFALANVEEIVSGIALIIVVLSVSWGVLTRYVTAQPASWAGEVAKIGFAWVVFLGAAAGAKRRLHISIDLLVAALPSGARAAVQLAVDLLAIVFSAYVTWLGIGFMIDNWDNPTSVLRMPLSVLYAAVALGFGLITLRLLAAMLGRAGGDPDQG